MIPKAINLIRTNQKIKQIFTLFSVNIIGIPLGIVTNILITRYLGAKSFGDYAFIINLFNLFVIIFTFGFFQAGNRALVLNNDKNKAKEYYGAEIVIFLLLFTFMVITLYTYTLLDANIEKKGLQYYLFILIPFSWIYLFVNYFEVLFQADNKIKLLAISRFFPKIGFFLSALLIFFVLKKHNINKLLIVFFFNLFTQAIVFIYVIYKISFSFKNLKLRIREVIKYNKEFGFNVYLGTIVSTGVLSLTGLLIGYFGVDNKGVGFYSLAITLTTPLLLIPNVIATTHYKDFSTQKKVDKKVVKLTLILSGGSLILLWLMIPFFISFFYGPEFKPVIFLCFIISIGSLFHGFADFFNRFIGSHGDGKALRNTDFILGFILIILNLTLVRFWGYKGAAITRCSSGIIYFLFMIYYYKKLIKKINT